MCWRRALGEDALVTCCELSVLVRRRSRRSSVVAPHRGRRRRITGTPGHLGQCSLRIEIKRPLSPLSLDPYNMAAIRGGSRCRMIVTLLGRGIAVSLSGLEVGSRKRRERRDRILKETAAVDTYQSSKRERPAANGVGGGAEGATTPETLRQKDRLAGHTL
jgi:hypothetical protein